MVRYIVIGIADARALKSVKTFLESFHGLNKTRKIEKSGALYQIYTKVVDENQLEGITDCSFLVDYYEDDALEKATLQNFVQGYFKNRSGDERVEELMQNLPKKWSIYPPMILFNVNTFDGEAWKRYLSSESNKEKFFKELLSSSLFPSNLTHVAVNKPIIQQDIMRRPFNVLPIYGDFGPEPNESTFDIPSQQDFEQAFWCTVVQNGIYQTWAPRYTMFSRGNIKEKKRILEKFPNLHGKYVFDLYVGIGYFTLSYLKNASTVFCWEINPWSIEGLIRSVTSNGYKYKLTRTGERFDQDIFNSCLLAGVSVFIFHESNEFAVERYTSIESQLPISHINMGLLPSSQPSWPIARYLATHSSITPRLHVHENVHIGDFEEMGQTAARYFNADIASIEKVKTFAPDVWHVVIDLQLPHPSSP